MTLTRLSVSILKSTVSDALTSIARRCSRTGVVTFSSEGRAQADDLFWVKLRRLPRASGAERSLGLSRFEVALDVEGVVDGSMSRKKSLSRS